MAEKIVENGRVMKYLIAPSMIIVFIMAFILPEFRLVGFLYLGMSIFSIIIFSLSKFKEEVFGLKKGIAQPIFIGGGTSLAFIVISSLFPSFSLLTPTLSLSISEDIRWSIIVILAPVIEECFRSASFGFIDEIYRFKNWWTTNIIQSLIFASIHVFVYGVTLSAYDKWIEAFGGLQAIMGSLLIAFAFGMVSGYIMKKTNGILSSITSHAILNFTTVTRGLVVVALVLPFI